MTHISVISGERGIQTPIFGVGDGPPLYKYNSSLVPTFQTKVTPVVMQLRVLANGRPVCQNIAKQSTESKSHELTQTHTRRFDSLQGALASSSG